ncbi:16S rRNA (adenine(1518)-N(6)/adenine(1519)-N(6))-dimethyltransferase RsmA [Deinococcus roseus]|uniref:Ribosomal RNA small subunit methyltransferase A n=1 Tax=Deinococcus roseus TaxID=392414 RepID=A0ABQ2D173_9DEIO|nr:ribosomal RNA small subunit methyltransferase A [Deinococcus roseus]
MEAPLYSPKVVHDLLERHGMRPTKAFGQNFLIDGNILRMIVQAGEPAGTVYEVGPGLGVLTRELAASGLPVITLEKDERLKPVLQETIADLQNVQIVWGDALEFAWNDVPAGSVLIANLPYYISTAILTRIFESGRFSRATFLVQKEVAQRLVALPGTDQYGFLSALTALHGKARIVKDVPKGAFYPAPDVTSSVVRVDLTGQKPPRTLLRLLEAGLAHRRKTLRNNLQAAGYATQKIDEVLAALQVSPTIRAEALSYAQWQGLHDGLTA